MTMTTTIELNGRKVTATAPASHTLLQWLRDQAQAYEVKEGCNEGVCGTCTVLADGRSVTACTVLAVQLDGATIETGAGLAGSDGNLNPLQQCFWEEGASQCGFCTQGMLMTATEMVRSGRTFTRDEIRDRLHGNLCRCTGYQSIIDAVEHAVTAGGADR